ncbi:MAG: BatD family protein [Rhodanobacteraceae bacterium]
MMRIVLLVLCLMASTPALATKVRAFLDRDTVHLGDTVTLNVSATDAVAVQAPDFSVLVPDFVLHGTSRNQSIRIDNGKVSKTVLFAVALDPRHTGKITIPAFTVDGQSSKPLVLNVLPADSRASGAPGDPVFLRADIEPRSLYVGQQAYLSIKLYYAGGSLQGKLDDPDVSSADLQPLGKQHQYQSQQAGQMYRVVERDYAVIPRDPGTLTIPPVRFRGQLIAGSSGFFGNARSFSEKSRALELDVRPKPASAGSGPWLPAHSVSLSMQGLPAAGKASVGTPITVTVTEKALGLGSESLPDPTLPAIDGAEIYPDKSQGQNDADGQWIEGTRVRKFAVVPTRPGTLEIPALAVDWWNVQTDKPETASVPARSLEVAGAAVTSSSTAAPPPRALVSTGNSPASLSSTPSSAAAPAVAAAQPGFWRWLALALAGLWLLTLLFLVVLWWRRRAHIAAPARFESASENSAGTRQQFRAASDTVGQAQAVLAWARAERPVIRNLGDLAAHLTDDTQKKILQELEQARFDDRTTPPQPAAVRKAFARGFAWRQDEERSGEDLLPPLYPRR